MKQNVSNAELKLWNDLQNGGVPLDEQVVEDKKAASRGLSIYQTGSIVESMAMDLEFGGCGFIFSAVISNESSRILCPHEFRLEMLWDEPQFRWLEDPSRKSPREYSYSLPPRGPDGFEREVVLNHRLGRNGKLNPGGHLDGLLLGVGQSPIPDKYHDGQLLVMRLLVFYGRGDYCESKMELLVSRGRGTRAKERVRQEISLVINKIS